MATVVPVSSIPHAVPKPAMLNVLAPEDKYPRDLKVTIVSGSRGFNISYEGTGKHGEPVPKKPPQIMVLAQITFPPGITGNQTGAKGAGEWPTDSVKDTNINISLVIPPEYNSAYTHMRQQVNNALAKFIGDGGLKELAEDNSKFGLSEAVLREKFEIGTDKVIVGVKANPSAKTSMVGFGPHFFNADQKKNSKLMQATQTEYLADAMKVASMHGDNAAFDPQGAVMDFLAGETGLSNRGPLALCLPRFEDIHGNFIAKPWNADSGAWIRIVLNAPTYLTDPFKKKIVSVPIYFDPHKPITLFFNGEPYVGKTQSTNVDDIMTKAMIMDAYKKASEEDDEMLANAYDDAVVAAVEKPPTPAKVSSEPDYDFAVGAKRPAASDSKKPALKKTKH